MEPRQAVRVVLLDSNNQVAIINVQKFGYYKIPGGRIETGETSIIAAQREVKEEAGCDCKIIAELGHTETKIPDWGMLDISDGFLAQVVGEKQALQLEEYEQARKFTLEWFSSLDEAIATIESNKVNDANAAKIQARDLSYLKLATKLKTIKLYN